MLTEHLILESYRAKVTLACEQECTQSQKQAQFGMLDSQTGVFDVLPGTSWKPSMPSEFQRRCGPWKSIELLSEPFDRNSWPWMARWSSP